MNMKNDNFNGRDYITLKEYIDDRFVNLEKSIDMRFDNVMSMTNSALASADKATLKAETAAEKRFEAVNEFRAVLTAQQNTFAPRSEIDLINKSINERLDKLENKIIATDGERSGSAKGIGWVVAIFGGVLGIAGIIFGFIK